MLTDGGNVGHLLGNSSYDVHLLVFLKLRDSLTLLIIPATLFIRLHLEVEEFLIIPAVHSFASWKLKGCSILN